MKISTYRIDLATAGQSFVFIPFCCTHWDHPGCHPGLFGDMVERAKNPRVYTLGLGDYLDFARAHYRAELQKALPDEDSPQHLDELVRMRLNQYLDAVRPLADRCVGLIEGNHTWSFITTNAPQGYLARETSTVYLSKQMGVPYLGHSALVTLEIHVEKPKFVDRYVIIANHGHGNGGSSAGADLNNLEKKIEPTFEADLYVTGHTHRRIAYFMPKMHLDEEQQKFTEKSHLLVKAGSFLRGYIPEQETYASRALMRPLDLGWVEIEIGYEIKNGRIKRKVTPAMTQRVDIGKVK